ncbi:unnamed protein product [Schistosoma curassoni]|uniref:Uncharacterized protein n=1 Tax=Schistosoma curassoni TaxID=6186 RepID=A0A3P8CSR6_9TREM|nr:unnamed protein product [Schistosoma curassoni]
MFIQCKNLDSGQLTESNIDKIRQLPRTHLLRVKHVNPIDNRPLIIRPVPGLPFKQINHQLGWYHIEIDHNDKNVILYLAGKQRIERYALFNLSTDDTMEICPWDQLTIEDFGIENEIITGIYMKHIKPVSFRKHVYCAYNWYLFFYRKIVAYLKSIFDEMLNMCLSVYLQIGSTQTYN